MAVIDILAVDETTFEPKMAAIDILAVDELLIIFNLLSLYDKLMAMR